MGVTSSRASHLRQASPPGTNFSSTQAGPSAAPANGPPRPSRACLPPHRLLAPAAHGGRCSACCSSPAREMPATTAAVLQPPPPPPPPVAAAANRVLSADRLEKLAVAFVCVANAILLARSPKAGASDAAWQAASAALPFLVLVLMLRLSRPAYLRVRAVLVPLLRLAYHAQRSERSATVRSRQSGASTGWLGSTGSAAAPAALPPQPPRACPSCRHPQETVAGVLLHGAPLPRAAGAAFDALRILLGVRLLSNAMISLLFPLPLPIAAAVHAAIVALTANSDAYCSAPVSEGRGGTGSRDAPRLLPRRERPACRLPPRAAPAHPTHPPCCSCCRTRPCSGGWAACPRCCTPAPRWPLPWAPPSPASRPHTPAPTCCAGWCSCLRPCP